MATAVLNTRVKVSDPKPGFCSGCHRGATEDVTFVDFNAAHDSGQEVHTRNGVVVKRVMGDDLHLCAACVRQAAETLGFRPEVHARQAAQIRRLELACDHWKDYALRMEGLVAERPEPVKKRGHRA